ncbi:MAG: phosphomethylpyrimidine synthase, partial [Candidatus Omnitrophica bacterium]|nr:phosphomethylpyrimidine synthase [Candidatus Omnitrophota bacterium]
MTQLEYAKNNIITPQAKYIASLENIPPKVISGYIKQGKAVIPLNKRHK